MKCSPATRLGLSLVAVAFCLGALMSSAPAAQTGAPPKNVIIWKEPGRFGGWPANNSGRWAWGKEIVVGFSGGYFKKVASGHAVDNARRGEALQGRSLDGGETWTIEPVKNEADDALLQSPEGIDFTRPDFAMRMSGSRYFISYDRAKSWKGPYSFPSFEGRRLQTRTDYLVLSKSHCLVFITASKSTRGEGVVLCAETRDGGKTWEFLNWISPEPSGYAIMPSSVRLPSGRILTAYRLQSDGRALIPIYASDDNGKTWAHLSDATEIPGGTSNPPAMVLLPDGRLALSYGYRWEPNGIRARVSSDAGKTWSKEIVLRDDAGNWDLGYPRMVFVPGDAPSVERSATPTTRDAASEPKQNGPDGKLVSMYYFNDSWDTERYIAATIWDPNYLPAYLSDGVPVGRLPAPAKEVTLSVKSDEPATCKYAAEPGVPYEQMPFAFATTGGTEHKTVVQGLKDATVYHYYVKSRDGDGNVLNKDYVITFATADPARSAVMVTVDASAGQLTAPMTLHEGDGAASGKYIATDKTNEGAATYKFTVPRDGKYFLWGRVFGSNYDQDSFFVAIDGSAELVFDTIGDHLPGSWLWRTAPNRGLDDFTLTPQPWLWTLSQGEHTLVFRGREPNARLDRIIITDDPYFLPLTANIQ